MPRERRLRVPVAPVTLAVTVGPTSVIATIIRVVIGRLAIATRTAAERPCVVMPVTQSDL